MNKPMIVSDEWREGYAAFQSDDGWNPYYVDGQPLSKFFEWEAGYMAAYLDWRELIGEAS